MSFYSVNYSKWDVAIYNVRIGLSGSAQKQFGKINSTLIQQKVKNKQNLKYSPHTVQFQSPAAIWFTGNYNTAVDDVTISPY